MLPVLLFACLLLSLLSSCTPSQPVDQQQTQIPAQQKTAHPLDPLTAEEIKSTTDILKTSGKTTNSSRFASLSLCEPPKSTVLNFKHGDRIKREACAVIYDLASEQTFEAKVDITNKSVVSFTKAPGSAPIMPQEVIAARAIVRADKDWQDAIGKRGITDSSNVFISVWAPGFPPPPDKSARREVKTIFYYNGQQGNPFIRPVEGLVATVDLQAKKISNLLDSGVIPVAIPRDLDEDKTYTNTKPKPLHMVQSQGPSFTIKGNEVRWQNWRFRFAVTPREGLVLHTVSYDQGGKSRPVLYRGSCSELCVPYADPAEGWAFRDSFDVGELGFGHSSYPLEELCDAPDNARFFDVIIANQAGEPVKRPHAVALYERDGGILWKHYDKTKGRNQSRRARDLVLSYVTTLANYDYGFNWIFHQDGTLEVETVMTGIMLAKGTKGDNLHAGHGHMVEKNIEAVHHQHFFCFRLDLDVDGAANNSFVETNAQPIPQGPDNVHGNAFAMDERKVHTELESKRLINLNSSRRWKVINENSKNALGQPTGYMLLPGENSVPYASANSFVRKKAGFLDAHVWVTPYDPAEMYAAGDYPYQATQVAGLPKWTAANRSIENQDIVLWYTMGITHVPRPEEWPIMPIHRSNFRLIPNGFFCENPVLSIPK